MKTNEKLDHSYENNHFNPNEIGLEEKNRRVKFFYQISNEATYKKYTFIQFSESPILKFRLR